VKEIVALAPIVDQAASEGDKVRNMIIRPVRKINLVSKKW
jgi:N-acetylglucosamine kinase-like BadF-type ATPase